MADQTTERRYSVQRLVIARPYSDGDYEATISVQTRWGDEIKIKLPEDRIEAMIESVSDLIVDSLSVQLGTMKEDFQHHIAERKAKQLEAPSIDAEVTA